MATTDWPTSLVPQTCVMSMRKSAQVFRSPLNGTVQTIDFVAERWTMSLTLPSASMRRAGAAESLLFGLTGGVNRVRCWHFARPAPRGTMRGSPVVAVAAARGDVSLSITTQAFSTLLDGDMIGVSGHLFMVGADAAADGAGAMTVTLRNRVRGPIAPGAPVTWDRPKAEFISAAVDGGVAFAPGVQQGPGIDLEEVY